MFKHLFRSYLTATCHYILSNEMHSNVLGTINMQERHTAENIALALENCISEWNLTRKVEVVVTDNGANVKKAIKDVLYYQHHSCIAHDLNLGVNDALRNCEDLSNVFEKCRKIVGFFKSSVVATEKLKEKQIEMEMPELKVKQDVPTRWNSKYIMIKRLMDIKLPLESTINSLSVSFDPVTSHEWKVITDILLVLQPFESLTSELSGEKYVTSSLIVPLIEGCPFNLKSLVLCTPEGNLLKSKFINEVFPNRFEKIYSYKYNLIATALDPRFKIEVFEREHTKRFVKNLLIREIDIILTENRISDCHSVEPAEETVPSVWQKVEKKRQEINAQRPIEKTAEEILERYLSLEMEKRCTNPLSWWSHQEAILPELYAISRKYLFIPATSVPSERVFAKQVYCAIRGEIGCRQNTLMN